MSTQTPVFVSLNAPLSYTPVPDFTNCSVGDANGNIYSSLNAYYGAIQKTDPSGNTTIFLQLNGTNTPEGSGSQSPSGMCFDSAGNLYYLVYNNNNIYIITNFVTPNPTLFNIIPTSPGIIPSAPQRIIIDKNNSNIFYISSSNPTGGIFSIKSYNSTAQLYNTIFNLSSPVTYGSSYGLAQDFSGSNLYIGVSGGRILKGALSGTSVSLWLTLPKLYTVIGLIFISNYTLIAQPVNNSGSTGFEGYGYIINIDPSTGIGTASLYYEYNPLAMPPQPISILGGLGLSSSSPPFLYGLSTTSIYTIDILYPSIQNTNYEIDTGEDLSLIFTPLLGTAGPNTGFEYYDLTTSSYKDICQLFSPYSSGTIPATNYISDLLPHSGKDLNLVFQGI